MASSTPRTETELNARKLKIRFSAAVQECFHDLAELVKASPYFDSEMVSTLQDWSAGKAPSVHDVMVAMPLIAEQMAAHVSQTKDQSVKDVWRGLCSQLPEEGFIVSQSRQRAR